MSSAKKNQLGKKAAEHLRAMERGKLAYKKAEELLEEILAKAKPGAEIPLPDGDVARLVDYYADRNRVFRAHGISRYGLERVDGVTGKKT